jgi:hypothetical protein
MQMLDISSLGTWLWDAACQIRGCVLDELRHG